jgi:hypothetical protein
MALREFEGFDIGYGKWTNYYSTVAGRFGGSAMWITSNSSPFLLDNQDTWIIGSAIQYYVSSGFDYYQLLDGSQIQLRVQMAAVGSFNYTLEVFNGAGTSLGITAALPNKASWNYIELKAVIHSSAGAFELRINNVTVLSATGVKTNGNAHNYASAFVLGNGYFDDLYICDGTGADHNDFLTDSKVQTFLPTSDGAHTAFTPSSGSDHFSRLQTNDGDTSYVQSGTLNDIDTYKITPGTITGVVQGVKIGAVVRKDNPASRDIGLVITDGGSTIAVLDDNVLTATYSEFTHIMPSNPVTSAPWVAADLATDEFGFKVTV